MNYFDYKNNELIMGNDLIERKIIFENNKPVSSAILNKETGHLWQSKKGDIINIPHFDWNKCKCQIDENFVIFSSNLTLLWEFKTFDKLPIIQTQLFVKGNPLDEMTVETDTASDGVEIKSDNSENSSFEVIDSIGTQNKNLKIECIEFFDNTDHKDTLIRKYSEMLYSGFGNSSHNGHTFIVDDYINNEECLIVKNAPCKAAHLNKTRDDLLAEPMELMQITGSGIDYSKISPNEYTPAYSIAIGVCPSGNSRDLFKNYYNACYPCEQRFIMSNTWGDRNQDKCICEEFILKEIDKAKILGVDVVQIDDGWQQGITANSGLKKGGAWVGGYRLSDPDFWNVNKDKFPNGLDKVIDYAKKNNIQIGLWFSPDAHNQYEDFQKDADTLFYYYQKYNIRYFKLDGINIKDKTSEINITKMLTFLTEKSNSQIKFNMDITAGRRFGYMLHKEFGTIFVENRYTDWGNYYPHNTLRNLWQLSEFIPANKLLFEVLNCRRNPDKYQNILAPENYSMDYIFATVMAGNPLLWMEMTGLNDEDVMPLSNIIKVYKKYRNDFVDVKPIGQCPDGLSLTGFEIKGNTNNYVILIRELSENDTFNYNINEVLYTNDKNLKLTSNSVVFSQKRSYLFGII